MVKELKMLAISDRVVFLSMCKALFHRYQTFQYKCPSPFLQGQRQCTTDDDLLTMATVFFFQEQY